ncbi:hypothetical protein ACFQT0_26475 [Hymenobacter humi]|uniref:Uncharacterized protein n=1 Tax=Hymenobacter humi TaxID=1411620 RepID=A0ABW2UCG0_9BACT
MMGIFDFLLAGGRSESKSAAPMAFEANLKFDLTGSASGKLDLSIPRGDRILKTPGSLSDGTAAVPNYDNVLGLIALLETPKIEYVVYANARTNGVLSVETANPSYDPNCNLGYDEYGYPLCAPETVTSSIGLYDDRVKQYRLVNDLKYAVNPAAGYN